MYKLLFYSSLFLFAFSSCGEKKAVVVANGEATTSNKKFNLLPYPTPPAFDGYWYAGKAELSTYDVVQERYGETRQAEQVNVFVTEDFSRKKQVKLDDPQSAGSDRCPVLKLNSIRRFKTGIYDYSIMQSVFSPVDGSKTLKTSSTIQDWCGQVFFQMNHNANGNYGTKSFSYFEEEGDAMSTIGNAVLEDEFWTKIRLGPEKIQTGKTQLIPSPVYARLRHKTLQAESAEIRIEKNNKENTLVIAYSDIPRVLKIYYENVSPYRITGWEETFKGSTQSKGSLKQVILSAYWSQNSNTFSNMRDSLRLKF